MAAMLARTCASPQEPAHRRQHTVSWIMSTEMGLSSMEDVEEVARMQLQHGAFARLKQLVLSSRPSAAGEESGTDMFDVDPTTRNKLPRLRVRLPS